MLTGESSLKEIVMDALFKMIYAQTTQYVSFSRTDTPNVQIVRKYVVLTRIFVIESSTRCFEDGINKLI